MPFTDNVTDFASHRARRVARPIAPASLDRLYNSEAVRRFNRSALKEQIARRRRQRNRLTKRACLGIALFAICYFAAQMIRAHMAGRI